MGLEELMGLEILVGFLTIVFVVVSIIIGIKLIMKYFNNNYKELITVGLTWIFLSSGWWGYVYEFIWIVFLDSPVDLFLKRVIGRIFLPFAIICWMYSFFSLVYQKKRMKVFFLYLVICITYEIFFILLLFTNPNSIVVPVREYNFATFSIYIYIFNFFALMTTLITGVIFAKNSFKSNKLIIQWKGRFLLLAFIIFSFGSIIDAVIFVEPPNVLPNVFIRFLLICSAILYYFGFFLPDKVSTFLIKDEKQLY